MIFTETERIGVNHTGQIFNRDFGWIFREQPISDIGIDAHIETVEHSHATGSLLALQIKTGESYFAGKGPDYIYHISDDHYQYWLGHSLPVFLVMHNPKTLLTLWQIVNKQTTRSAGASWALSVPGVNTLTIASKAEFTKEIRYPLNIASNLILNALPKDLILEFLFKYDFSCARVPVVIFDRFRDLFQHMSRVCYWRDVLEANPGNWDARDFFTYNSEWNFAWPALEKFYYYLKDFYLSIYNVTCTELDNSTYLGIHDYANKPKYDTSKMTNLWKFHANELGEYYEEVFCANIYGRF